jgi:hypothetical protein
MLKGAERKIKKEVGEAMANEMRGRIRDDACAAADGVTRQLDEAKRAVRTALDTQLTTVREEAQAVLDAKQAGEAAACARRTELHGLATELDDAVSQLNNIVDEIASL